MSPESERVEILVIGAGYGGVGVGITLLKEGIDDFIIIEAEDDVGGTWRTNRYPGCACDVPSHLYSYSFEPNPEWPQAFSEHADIERYIQHCADKYGVRSKSGLVPGSLGRALTVGPACGVLRPTTTVSFGPGFWSRQPVA